MKQWTTVGLHKGYAIQTLNGAEIGDCMDYRVDPPLMCHPNEFPTIAAAVSAIEFWRETKEENGIWRMDS